MLDVARVSGSATVTIIQYRYTAVRHAHINPRTPVRTAAWVIRANDLAIATYIYMHIFYNVYAYRYVANLARATAAMKSRLIRYRQAPVSMVPVRSTISADHSFDLTFVLCRINTVKGVKRARIRAYSRSLVNSTSWPFDSNSIASKYRELMEDLSSLFGIY